MSKFFPSYQLFIEVQDGEIISLPEEYATDREFACKFTVTQTTTSSPQNATINIYNLSDSNRKRIFFNWFDQVSVMKKVSLYAGYNEEKHLIFDGVQQEVSTYREGASLVTEIHGTCLGFAQNGYEINKEANTSYITNTGSDEYGDYEDQTFEELIKEDPFTTEIRFEFEAGVKRADILTELVQEFSNMQSRNDIEHGVNIEISDDTWLQKKFNKPVTLIGNIFDLIKQYAPPNTNVWYNKGTLYILSTDIPLYKNLSSIERSDKLQRYWKARERKEEKKIVKIKDTPFKTLKAVSSSIQDSNVLIINADTGLLNTPRFYGQSMQLTTLFEPRVNCGDLIRLESAVQPEFNRDYKVCGVTHSCEMGFGTSGSNITSLTLVYPNSNFMDVGYTL